MAIAAVIVVTATGSCGGSGKASSDTASDAALVSAYLVALEHRQPSVLDRLLHPDATEAETALFRDRLREFGGVPHATVAVRIVEGVRTNLRTAYLTRRAQTEPEILVLEKRGNRWYLLPTNARPRGVPDR